jgi:hypothetical protein
MERAFVVLSRVRVDGRSTPRGGPFRHGVDRKESRMDVAYLDAGSGSLIVQAVIGGVAGVAVAAKLYWRRLTGRFRKQPAEKD